MSRPSTTTDGRIILDAAGLARKVEGLSKAIAKEFSSRQDEVALIGIQTRGVTLAHRVAEQLKREWKREIPVGTLDITLYRDDVHAIADQPEVKETVIPFDIEHRTLILVDDVLFTGRTVGIPYLFMNSFANDLLPSRRAARRVGPTTLRPLRRK